MLDIKLCVRDVDLKSEDMRQSGQEEHGSKEMSFGGMCRIRAPRVGAEV